jgi:hypothetical protein
MVDVLRKRKGSMKAQLILVAKNQVDALVSIAFLIIIIVLGSNR